MRTLAINQNITVDGSIEMLASWLSGPLDVTLLSKAAMPATAVIGAGPASGRFTEAMTRS